MEYFPGVANGGMCRYRDRGKPSGGMRHTSTGMMKPPHGAQNSLKNAD